MPEGSTPIAQRFGDEILDHGFIPVPRVFVRLAMRHLGLSAMERLLIENLWDRWRPDGPAVVSVRTLAWELCLTERRVRAHLAALQRKGYLVVHEQRGAANTYDWQPLLDALRMALRTLQSAAPATSPLTATAPLMKTSGVLKTSGDPCRNHQGTPDENVRGPLMKTSGVIEREEKKIKNKKTRVARASPSNTTADDASGRKDERWSALYSTILEVCYPGTPLGQQSQRERQGAAICARSLLAAAATPEEVRRRAAVFRQRHPGFSLTPWALEKNWSALHEEANGARPRGSRAIHRPSDTGDASDLLAATGYSPVLRDT